MNPDVSAPQNWIERSGPDRLSLFGDTMRRNWGIAVSVLTACVAAALVLAFVLPSYWRVEIVVIPVKKGNNVNVSAALGGGLGGLGALLGQNASNEDEALAVLRSRELFDAYASQNNLLPVLYAEKWDAAKNRWTVPPESVPTLRRAFKLFNNEIRDVDLDRRTGIVTMGITWKDRALAMQWARGLIDLTNSQLRERAIADAQRNMNYLNDEIRKASAASAQNALTAALASAYDRELQNYMFAKGQPEFAFRVIDAPTFPDDRERVWPQRALFLALGFILGCLLAVMTAYIGDYFKARRAAKNPRALPSQMPVYS